MNMLAVVFSSANDSSCTEKVVRYTRLRDLIVPLDVSTRPWKALSAPSFLKQSTVVSAFFQCHLSNLAQDLGGRFVDVLPQGQPRQPVLYHRKDPDNECYRSPVCSESQYHRTLVAQSASSALKASRKTEG